MINHATQQATLDAPTETLECQAEKAGFCRKGLSIYVSKPLLGHVCATVQANFGKKSSQPHLCGEAVRLKSTTVQQPGD